MTLIVFRFVQKFQLSLYSTVSVHFVCLFLVFLLLDEVAVIILSSSEIQTGGILVLAYQVIGLS